MISIPASTFLTGMSPALISDVCHRLRPQQAQEVWDIFDAFHAMKTALGADDDPPKQLAARVDRLAKLLLNDT